MQELKTSTAPIYLLIGLISIPAFFILLPFGIVGGVLVILVLLGVNIIEIFESFKQAYKQRKFLERMTEEQFRKEMK